MIDLRVADITTLAVDAIINAANERFRGGGGVDGAIIGQRAASSSPSASKPLGFQPARPC